MLVKIEIPPQEKQIQGQEIKIVNHFTFIGEVIGLNQDLESTAWIINPKSLQLWLLDSDSLIEVLSLRLVKKEDIFKLKIQSRVYGDLERHTFDVASVEEVANFPPI